MNTICGAKCDECDFRDRCAGCEATCGKPFGGACVAAEYIKVGGKKKYAEFKEKLLSEVNELLAANDIPAASALYELAGMIVNLAYTLPSGETVKFLDDGKIYLGAQIECGGICFGAVADTTFILVCAYREGGADPELIAYKRR